MIVVPGTRLLGTLPQVDGLVDFQPALRVPVLKHEELSLGRGAWYRDGVGHGVDAQSRLG